MFHAIQENNNIIITTLFISSKPSRSALSRETNPSHYDRPDGLLCSLLQCIYRLLRLIPGLLLYRFSINIRIRLLRKASDCAFGYSYLNRYSQITLAARVIIAKEYEWKNEDKNIKNVFDDDS